MEISVTIIKPKNETIKSYMLHRMSCFEFDTMKGDTSCKLKTSVYANSDLLNIIEQRQNGVPLLAMPSSDVLLHYIGSEYDIYSDEAWAEMNDGDHEIVNLTIVWQITDRKGV